MKVLSAGLSDVGQVRTNNEDSLLIDESMGLFVVADGMGGQDSGEVASRVALRALYNFLNKGEVASKRKALPLNVLANHLKEGVDLADDAVRALARGGRGMGTTLTALWFGSGGAVMAHVGDSRLYRLQDEIIEQVSHDHSFTAIALRQGSITAEQAATHAMRNTLMHSLGGRSKPEIDVEILDIEPDDTFLLCSDGLTEYLDDDELENVLMAMDLKAIARRLINIANERGGGDNITVVLVRLSSGQEGYTTDQARLPTLMDHAALPRPHFHRLKKDED